MQSFHMKTPLTKWVSMRLHLLHQGARCGRLEGMQADTTQAIFNKLHTSTLKPNESQTLSELVNASLLSAEAKSFLENAILDITHLEIRTRIIRSPSGSAAYPDTPCQDNKFFQNYFTREEWDFMSTMEPKMLRQNPQVVYGLILKAMDRTGWLKVGETAWCRDILSPFKALGFEENDLLHKAQLKKHHKAFSKDWATDGPPRVSVFPEDPLELEEPWGTSSRRDGDLIKYPFNGAQLMIVKAASPTRNTHWSVQGQNSAQLAIADCPSRTVANRGNQHGLATQAAIANRGNPNGMAQPALQYGLDPAEMRCMIRQNIQEVFADLQNPKEDIAITTFPRRALPGVGRAEPKPSEERSLGELGARPSPGTTGLANLICETQNVVANKRAKTEAKPDGAGPLPIERAAEDEEEDDEEEEEEEEEKEGDEDQKPKSKGHLAARAKSKAKAKPRAMKAMKVVKAPSKRKAEPTTKRLSPSDLVSPGTNPANFPVRAGCATVYLDQKHAMYRVKPGPSRKDLTHVAFSENQAAAWKKVVQLIKTANA